MILMLIKENPSITRREIVNKIECSDSTVKKNNR